MSYWVLNFLWPQLRLSWCKIANFYISHHRFLSKFLKVTRKYGTLRLLCHRDNRLEPTSLRGEGALGVLQASLLPLASPWPTRLVSITWSHKHIHFWPDIWLHPFPPIPSVQHRNREDRHLVKYIFCKY